MFGRSHTHHRGVAGGRWKKRAQKTQRLFKPNLKAFMIIEDGETKRVKLCMKCLKRIKKDTADGKKPFLTLAYGPKVNVIKKEGSNKSKEKESPTVAP